MDTFLTKVPFAPCGFALSTASTEGLDVAGDLLLREARLADARLDDARLLDAELDRAALGRFDRRRHIHGHGADLGVRHQAARAQHLTQTADEAHHVGRRNAAVELDRALADDLEEIIGANDIGPGLLRLLGLGPLAKPPTRTLRPDPFGRLHTPRTIWSAWRGSTPRFMATSIVSSNLALARALTSFTASPRP